MVLTRGYVDQLNVESTDGSLPVSLSRQDAADLQHRDEEQSEGSHYDRGGHVLEVDISKHRCPGDGLGRLSLEHGGGFPTYQSIRSARQSGRMSDYQLQN